MFDDEKNLPLINVSTIVLSTAAIFICGLLGGGWWVIIPCGAMGAALYSQTLLAQGNVKKAYEVNDVGSYRRG